MSGLIYATVQQDIRMGANDPQIEIAQNFAITLAANQSFKTMFPRNTVELSSSLSPYIIIFNDQGVITTTSGVLHGNMPVLPKGAFADAKRRGELRFTWQPEEEVREAVVLEHYSGSSSGFVLAGRSMFETEKREEHILLLVFMGWITCLGMTFISSLLYQALFSRKSGKTK